MRNFKNPCWWEDIGKPPFYKENWLAKELHIAADLEALRLREKRKGKKVQLRCLPYFHIIGFPKCGTTDLFYMLHSHGLIHSTIKEKCYWGWAQTGQYTRKFAFKLGLNS